MLFFFFPPSPAKGERSSCFEGDHSWNQARRQCKYIQTLFPLFRYVLERQRARSPPSLFLRLGPEPVLSTKVANRSRNLPLFRAFSSEVKNFFPPPPHTPPPPLSKTRQNPWFCSASIRTSLSICEMIPAFFFSCGNGGALDLFLFSSFQVGSARANFPWAAVDARSASAIRLTPPFSFPRSRGFILWSRSVASRLSVRV